MKVAFISTLLLIGTVFVSAQDSHSLTIEQDTVRFVDTQASFSAYATDNSALGLEMYSQVFDANTNLVATGNSAVYTTTFSAVRFYVPFPSGTFQNGQDLFVSVSDVPGSLDGSEGASLLVIFAGVPTLGTIGLIAFVGFLMLFGVRHMRKTRLA